MNPVAILAVSLWLKPAGAPPACQEPAPQRERDRGIDSLLRGQPYAAQAQLAEAMRRRPGDRAADALRDLALERLGEEQRRAAGEARAATVVALPALPLDRPRPSPAPGVFLVPATLSTCATPATPSPGRCGGRRAT